MSGVSFRLLYVVRVNILGLPLQRPKRMDDVMATSAETLGQDIVFQPSIP